MVMIYYCIRRVAFFEGYKFCEWNKKGSLRKIFSRIYIASLQSAIHVMIEFPLIFGEKMFVEVPKIHEIRKICSSQKRNPMVACLKQLYHEGTNIKNVAV